MAATTFGGDKREALRGTKIGLFIPCYTDLVFPEVGIATLELQEKFRMDVSFPLDQTCCGQPMSNSGDEANSAGARTTVCFEFQRL